MAESAAPTGPFQYILCAATSPAVKQEEESLTYLNQGEPLSSWMHVLASEHTFRAVVLKLSRYPDEHSNLTDEM